MEGVPDGGLRRLVGSLELSDGHRRMISGDLIEIEQKLPKIDGRGEATARSVGRIRPNPARVRWRGVGMMECDGWLG